MQKMAKSNVFLSGLGGLGVEVGEYVESPQHCCIICFCELAKNIALAGVKVNMILFLSLITRDRSVSNDAVLDYSRPISCLLA